MEFEEEGPRIPARSEQLPIVVFSGRFALYIIRRMASRLVPAVLANWSVDYLVQPGPFELMLSLSHVLILAQKNRVPFPVVLDFVASTHG